MKRIALAALLLAGVTAVHAQTGSPREFTRHVDPFIGSDGTGHVFPGAARPFGMVAPSPDNAGGGWTTPVVTNIARRKSRLFHTSAVPAFPILGDVLLQPVDGTPWSAATTDFSSTVDKKSESGAAGLLHRGAARPRGEGGTHRHPARGTAAVYLPWRRQGAVGAGWICSTGCTTARHRARHRPRRGRMRGRVVRSAEPFTSRSGPSEKPRL